MKLLLKAMTAFDRIVDSLAVVAAVLLFSAMIITALEVISRQFLNRPLIWVVESTEYILVWFTFLSAAWILKRDKHVIVDVVVVHLSSRNKDFLEIIDSILGVISCSIVVVYGAGVTWDCFQRGLYFLTLLRIPKAPLYAVIPICNFLLVVQFLRKGYASFVRWRVSAKRMK